ncbi:MAG: RNA 2',3'-cyclic phosphodiesterase [Candidatus Methanomethylophilaceae archaeon]|nr:RNA 2',3'-cyclic phosphodiesterase [Candidatus Methanomethylophilaceae archaeon]
MDVRTFVSIPVPATEGVLRVSEDLRRTAGVRVTPADKLHLTLCFIGDVDEKLIPEVGRCVTASVRGMGPGELTLKDVGVFPDIRKPRVVWIGVSTDMPLKDVADRLGAELDAKNISRDGKPFKPHVTVGRIPDNADLRTVTDRYRGVELGSFGCSSVKIMKSELLPSGAKHTVLNSVVLEH